jgi:hypothetical protein
MSESSATATLRAHLKASGSHVQRFEDKLSPGIPDTMAVISGFPVFLEGKFVKDLPVRDDTLVRFGAKGEPRLTHQRNWLVAHRKAGGLSFWWIRVRDGGWYLFEDKFDWIVDGVPKKVLLAQEDLGSAKAMVVRLRTITSGHIKTLSERFER